MNNIENYRDALRAVQKKEIEQRKTIKKLLQDREELKKQLALYGVVKQSELLIAFAEWKEYNGKWETHEQQVKNFLKEYKSN